MRILILNDDFPPKNLGGAGVVALATAKELKKLGHEVRVVTTKREGIAEKNSYQGIDVFSIPSDYDNRFQAYMSLWNPRVVDELKKILREFKPDVVHAHNVHKYLSYASLKAAKANGARVILTCHDVMSFNYNKLVETIDPSDISIPATFNYEISAWRQLKDTRWRYNPLRNVIIRHILRAYVDKILAVSFALKDALEQNGVTNIEVVHNGVDATQPNDESVQAFKDKYHIGDSAIFFTGKPIGVKGGLILLDALKTVAKDFPHFQLLVVGREDSQTERLHEHARSQGLEERVVITGWLQGVDLEAAYASSALVVVPSLSFDSFPTVNLEAMAAHKPVIASCFGGSREAIEDGVTGYIINPFDVQTMSRKITQLLVDGNARTQMGEAGYKRLMREFTIDRQAKEFEKYYRR